MSDFIEERKRKLKEFKELISKKEHRAKIEIPDGLFVKCDDCGSPIYEKELESNASVCPNCGYHFRIGARKRLILTVDEPSFMELDNYLTSSNPLDMPQYLDKLSIAEKITHQNEAFVSGIAKIESIPCAVGVLDSYFMMGSMGSVVGEKITRLVEYATLNHLPLIIFSASGGARMQEGILSLMQMAKTSAALLKLHEAKGLFISVMTNPTTGGVAASYASLGDIIIAEKSALIGFAGARVIRQTIGQDLPPHFQTSQFQLEHGQVDMVLSRFEIRPMLAKLLKLHGGKRYE